MVEAVWLYVAAVAGVLVGVPVGIIVFALMTMAADPEPETVEMPASTT
jgi:hypothetical protein